MTVQASVVVALVLLGVGTVLFLVGFSTPYWVEYKYETWRGNLVTSKSNSGRKTYREKEYFVRTVHFGLWRHCMYIKPGDRDNLCLKYISEQNTAPKSRHGKELIATGDHRAAQFFETVPIFMVVASFVLLVLGAVVAKTVKTKQVMHLFAGLLALMSSGSVFLGAMIFASMEKAKDDLAWSIALAVVGGVFFFVSGAVTLVGIVLKK